MLPAPSSAWVNPYRHRIAYYLAHSRVANAPAERLASVSGGQHGCKPRLRKAAPLAAETGFKLGLSMVVVSHDDKVRGSDLDDDDDDRCN